MGAAHVRKFDLLVPLWDGITIIEIIKCRILCVDLLLSGLRAPIPNRAAIEFSARMVAGR